MRAVITLLPGDGIGPEVVAEGARVLRAVAAAGGHQFELREALLGGCAIEATGQPLPAATLAACQSADAVLLGAVGGPRWDNPDAAVRPEQGLLGLRQALGLFANLRPVTIHPALVAISPLRPERLQGVDLLVVRELTGGIYFGEHRRERQPDGEEQARDTCVYTTGEIARVVRTAAGLARERRHKLTSVDKANVLETSRLWRSVTTRIVRDEFPDVALDHLLVDACAMHLLRRPADFDVIVTENMFGDILTDEAAMLAGSLGLLPSASLGARPSEAGRPRMGLYEPIHGSAPDIAGQGVANPLAAILSFAMALQWSLGQPELGGRVTRAVDAALAAGARTRDIGGTLGTVEMTDAVLAHL
ncbi:MAG TPA: 3-isopropylmalate dehydrogenase [Chloroflexia bacterium]|nr:3-isopropylmalate dehydrogenase [Chloroflexia bacterium]